MLRELYRLFGFLGSTVGLLALALLGTLFVSDGVPVNPLAAVAILAGLATMSFFAYYSFFDGAQPGHIVRAINIWLCALWNWLTYADYAANSHANLTWSSGVWLFGCLVIFINLRLRPVLAAQFRDNGRVNYFDVYFADR